MQKLVRALRVLQQMRRAGSASLTSGHCFAPKFNSSTRYLSSPQQQGGPALFPARFPAIREVTARDHRHNHVRPECRGTPRAAATVLAAISHRQIGKAVFDGPSQSDQALNGSEYRKVLVIAVSSASVMKYSVAKPVNLMPGHMRLRGLCATAGGTK